MSVSQTLYRTALSYDVQDTMYPNLAGHADFALPYIGRMVRTLADPKFAHPQSQEFFRAQIRDVADEYTFTTEFLKAMRFYRANRNKWSDEDIDNLGRAYHDVIGSGTSENVPF